MLTSSFINAALAATVAWTVSAAAMPLQGRDSSSDGCSVYGIYPLAFNASGIENYSNQPAARFAMYDFTTKRVITAPPPNKEGGGADQFVFNNCSYVPGPYPGQKGNIESYQGFIQTVSGGKLQCLTASELKSQNATLGLADCKLDASQPGGVDPAQHFQWQGFSFKYYINVLFLGESDGKSTEQQFQQGDRYHWSSENQSGPQPLFTSYNPTSSDAKENPSEYLIAQ